ncbi:MAG: Holliday junction branch migration DNA helicase RuvB [bacterium]
MVDRIISGKRDAEDDGLEASLRPRYLRECIGQEKVKESIAIFIEAAKSRREALDHVLLYGPPGLGKTMVANVIANELGVSIHSTSGPVIERQGDLAAILTNLQEDDVLFIDEIHRLSHVVEEVLYPAMEDFELDIIVGQGPSARSIKIPLPRFTLVGATTRAGLLTAPLRSRFGILCRFELYDPKELRLIILRAAKVLGIEIEDDGAWEIAKRSRGTPRVATRLLKRVRDFAEVRANGRITREIADSALQMLEIDYLGLDNMDKRIIKTIIEKFGGGPVGIETIAVAVGEEKDTIEDVYEPYLIQIGFIQRTPRGREATPRAYAHFGYDWRNRQRDLFE